MKAVYFAKMLVPLCHITPCDNTEDDGMTLPTWKHYVCNKSGTVYYPQHYLTSFVMSVLMEQLCSHWTDFS